MADLSAEKLGSILEQAEMAAIKIRAQRDHLQASQVMLEGDAPPSDVGGLKWVKDLVSGQIEEFRYEGLHAGARHLTAVLAMAAAEDGSASLALNSSFPVMPEEQLHDALLAHAEEIPEGSTAFSRVEAALFAVKLAREFHLPRCVQHLAQISSPVTAGGGGQAQAPDNALCPQEAASMEQASICLGRALTLVKLALEHVDVAAATMSGFLYAKEAADAGKDGIIT